MAFVLRSGERASRALNIFDLYPQKLVNLPVKQKKELKEIEGFEALMSEIESQGFRQLIRYSGTENKLRILLEGKDGRALEKCMERCVEFFKATLGG